MLLTILRLSPRSQYQQIQCLLKARLSEKALSQYVPVWKKQKRERHVGLSLCESTNPMNEGGTVESRLRPGPTAKSLGIAS